MTSILENHVMTNNKKVDINLFFYCSPWQNLNENSITYAAGTYTIFTYYYIYCFGVLIGDGVYATDW